MPHMDYSLIGARRFALPMIRIINSRLTALGSGNWAIRYGAQNPGSLQAGVYCPTSFSLSRL